MRTLDPLARRSGGSVKESPLKRVPALLHQVWMGDAMPSKFADFTTRWRELHPRWIYNMWTEDRVLDLIEDDALRAVFVRAEDLVAGNPYQFKSDIARYVILEQRGGVYVDCDTEPLRALDDVCADVRCWFAWERDDVWVGNTYVGAQRHHPFIQQLLAGIPASVASHERRHRANVVSGPQYVTEMLKVATEAPVIYPQRYFYPYSWDQLEDGPTRAPGQDVYAIHHWANARRRRGLPL